MEEELKKIRLRNGTEAQWISANPVLLAGEFGITMDTVPKKFKIGDGASTWSSLSYNISSVGIADIPGLQIALDAKEDEFAKNTAFNKDFGSITGTVCEGNDSRLSDSRNPLPHNQDIDTINGLEIVLNNKEPLKGTDDNYVTDAQLAVIANTSGVNTGDQDLSGLQPKETGKGLSTNDYNTTDKTKVDTIVITGDGSQYLANNGTYKTISGGSTAIQNNGTSLPQQSAINFRGKQLIADNATNTSTDIQLFPNLNPDWYINQNVYPSLEWIWKHTDGFWYFVVMTLSQTSGYVGNTGRKFKVYKTIDWVNNIEVCSYEHLFANVYINPKIAIDLNGNVLVTMVDANVLRAVFFNAADNYSITLANIAQNANYSVETTISLNVSADNRFGVAFFQKHAGSTSYSQLMYVERSAGSGGTWGTPEILGTTPLRATTVTSSGAIQLFYTSANEPIIAFLNNASATSSKVAIAKKVSGTWTIYDSGNTTINCSVIDSGNNIIITRTSTGLLFTYATNSFTSTSSYGNCAIDNNNDIYGVLIEPTEAISLRNIYYIKNTANTFHRAIRQYMQIGAVISANAYSTLGVYTVIPYSRQRLANAYHLVIRTDGAIFMEVI